MCIKKQGSILFLFLFFLLLHNSLLSQQRIDSLLNILDTKYPQEKIHVHYDKSFYNAGETIWFKAYIAIDNAATAFSKTMYADLLDDKGALLQRKMVPVLQSGAASNFDLPDTIHATRLFVRAYTAWMLNFDSSLIYTKPIQILPSKNSPKKIAIAATYAIQFFPEGGDLIENIPSRIAFKANDNQGIPFTINGDIIDSKGKKIASFSSVHDGMGMFELLPMANEKYTANWRDKNGMQHITMLPICKKEGAVLSVTMTENKLIYTINRPDSAAPEFCSYHVIAQMQQHIMYSAQINLKRKTSVNAPIDTDSLPDGILQLTIFNAAEIPVAERLVFINHNNYSFITDLHAVEKNLVKRGHNALQVDVGGNLLSNLSISITDDGINPVTKDEESIYSGLLLSSDVKGTVYNPAYYFSSDEDAVKAQLDLVMMTHGWRRFAWKDVLAAKWPVIKYIPENYLALNGKVLGLSRTSLYKKELTGILKTKNGATNFFSLPIDNEGNFHESGAYFFDTAKLYFQLSNDKDRALTTAASFSFLSNFIKVPPVSVPFLSSLQMQQKADSVIIQKSSALAALQRNQSAFNKAKTLDAVIVKRKQKSLKEKLEEEYTSGFFAGGDGYSFTTDDDPSAKTSGTVLAYLQGKVAGLQISTIGDGSATWRGSVTGFFLNEVNSSVGALQSINMNDVALIKVFRPPFFGGAGGGAGGAIAIYTKKGVSDNGQVTGLPFSRIDGYSVIKEFYSPDYETSNEPDLKDYRSTLYWNPFLFFDKVKRRITIPFYNSDNCKKIRVTIEGINEAGQLTREEKIIE